MRLALLVLAFLPSCAMVGHGTQRSVEAGGIAATSVIGTPLLGFASWPLWNWVGGYAGTWLSDTEEIRVKARSEPANGSDASTDLPRQELPWWGGSPLGSFTGGNMIWIIIGIAAFVYLGGLTWLKGQIAKAKKETEDEAAKKLLAAKADDDRWADALAKDRAEHRAATAALTAKVELLEKLLTPRQP